MPRVADPRHAPDCTIEVDGRPVPARAGESVAVALLAAGRVLLGRSAKYHRPRGAFCLAGSCHACVARIDGVPSQRTCRVPARPGLVVETQHAFPAASGDVLAAIDHVYARGLDHHHLATWSLLANRAAVALSRQLAGAGELPDATPPPRPRAAVELAEALVVGGGPAGLGAAEMLARGGRRVLLAEADARPGGRLRCGLGTPGEPPPGWPAEVARAVERAGGEVAVGTSCVGFWHDRRGLVAALRADAPTLPLRLVRGRAVVLATGSHALPPLWPRNDLPGILAGRGLARALAEDGVLPGRRCVVAGADPDAEAFTARMAAEQVEVRTVGPVAAARGGARLTGLLLADGERVPCDALAWWGARVPASELARLAGAAVEPAPEGGWRVRAGPDGATGVPGVRAAGEVTGTTSAAGAVDSGRRAGEASLGDG